MGCSSSSALVDSTIISSFYGDVDGKGLSPVYIKILVDEIEKDSKYRKYDKGKKRIVLEEKIEEKFRERYKRKLLLLGAGSSGKSTLYKSLRINEQKNEDSELVESRHVIRQNIIAGTLTLLKRSQELYEMDADNI